ncbi:MAG: FemAB family PEP-CTERM system-associated protein [Woeseiaceae bacterium]|nr:FemAB family PEP-CTERM system-associated protein [Woeseiaceae bacterium]
MTIAVKYIDSAGQSAWNAYVAGHPQRSVYHRYEWRGFFEDYFGKECWYLVAEDGDRTVGVAPIVRQQSRLFGDYMVSLPFVNYGGILADSGDAEAAIAAEVEVLAGRTGVSHVELRGLAPVANLPGKTNKVAMHLELPADEDELAKRLGSKLRSQIRRPQRENPEVLTGGIELLDDFYAVFSRNMRDLGTPVYAKSMFADLLTRFPRDTGIVAVRLGGRSAAAGFLLHHGQRSEVPWASSDRRYNRIGINMLLYWEMLRESLRRGSTLFDFGRSSRDAGTYRFKKQWGAEPVQLHWSYVMRDQEELPELNPENSRFALAIRAWQRLPVWTTRLLGPPLARNLP